MEAFAITKCVLRAQNLLESHNLNSLVKHKMQVGSGLEGVVKQSVQFQFRFSSNLIVCQWKQPDPLELFIVPFASSSMAQCLYCSEGRPSVCKKLRKDIEPTENEQPLVPVLIHHAVSVKSLLRHQQC